MFFMRNPFAEGQGGSLFRMEFTLSFCFTQENGKTRRFHFLPRAKNSGGNRFKSVQTGQKCSNCFAFYFSLWIFL